MIRILLFFVLFSHSLYAVTIGEYLSNRSGIKSYKMGDYQSSVENFSEALSDGSESSEVYNNIGQVFYESDDFEQAEKLFSTSLSTADKLRKPDVLYHLGNTAVKKEDYAAALGYYKQALMLNPHHEEAKRNFEYAFHLQEQEQKNLQQESDDSKDGDDEDEQEKEKPKPQDEQGDDADESQGAEQTEEEKKQELTEQMLEFLSDKEQAAREKYKKKPVMEATVEKDW